MTSVITDNIDIWTSAVVTKKSVGRGTSKKQESYGIKKLRELILELAVRGKLVPQDSNDEAASVLLEKIAEEKKRLIDKGEIKKQKPLSKIGEKEIPFALTENWIWIRLGNAGIGATGKTPSTKDTKNFNGDIPFLGPGQITPSGQILEAEKFLSEMGIEYSVEALEGDIIMVCIGGSIGKSAIVNQRLAFNQQLNLMRPLFISSKYLKIAVSTDTFYKSLLEKATGSATPIINRGKWEELLIPLPPLNEQKRIVAKVNELMALCDKLEQEQEENSTTHQTLVETLLNTLTDVETSEEFSQNWQRIAEHFETLFTTEQSIDKLQETILQLAVMGKLVPQDPNDEPASVLLEKIAKEKKRLTEEGKIKKQKSSPEISEEEKPIGLPLGWAFVRLSNLSKLITKGSSPKWQGVSYTEDSDDILFVTSENVGSYELLLDNRKYVEKKFNKIEPKSVLEKGDFLMNIVGASIGRTAIYDIDDLANINQAVCLIRAFPNFIDGKYLLHFFNSQICVSYMFDKQVDNARANLSMSNIAKFVIPLPPLAEQHRIVCKADELIALCDNLRLSLRKLQVTQINLADTVAKHLSE